MVINEEEARRVRAIFDLYLEHRALPPVVDHLQRWHWTTKRWTTKAGRLHAGRAFAQQDVAVLLRNPIYTGKVHYQGQVYQGEHAVIIEERVWQRVQRMLKENVHLARQVRRADRQLVQDAPVERPQERAPRIARLLALALKFEGLIHQGVVQDYAELARLGQVSRARVTQIMNLLNLAADIQEEILDWTASSSSNDCVSETTIRALSSEISWSRQRELWKKGSTHTSVTRSA